MAISTTERSDILELVVLMFDAAPGANHLAEITALFEATGRSIQTLAAALASTGAFLSLHPAFESAEEFAASMLTPLALQGDGEARDWVVAQFNAGASRSSILFAAWDVLDDLSDSAAPQYVNAKAIMENKAAVAEFYSVTLQQSSSNLFTLRDVVSGVTADPASVDHAIDEITNGASIGTSLTTSVDTILVSGTANTRIAGIVDGDADGNSDFGTFNPGDRIRGNGNTHVELTIVEGGSAGFERLENVSGVSIVAGTDGAIDFNAASWEAGSVRLDGGVDGLQVFLDNLRTGTEIAVADVTGAISATFDSASGDLYASIRNGVEGSAGASLGMDAQGNVSVTLAASASGSIANRDATSLGDIAVAGGDEADFSAMFDVDTGITVGDIAIATGLSSALDVRFDAVDGAALVGEVSLQAGGDSSAQVTVKDVTGTASFGSLTVAVGDASAAGVTFSRVEGALTVGETAIGAGNASEVKLGIDAVADVTVAGVTLRAGDESIVTLAFDSGAGTGEDGAGALQMGDVSLEAGLTSNIDFTIGRYATVKVGNVSAEAGAASSLDFVSGPIDGGFEAQDVTLTSGNESSATFVIDGAADIAAGRIGVSAGEEGMATVDLRIEGNYGDVTLGDASAAAGDGGQAQVLVFNSNENVGTFSAGHVSAHAGDDSLASVSLAHGGTLAPTADNTGASAGDLTVGDVSVSIGDLSSVEADANAVLNLLYGSKAGDTTSGRLNVGDIELSVGDGAVSGSAEKSATAYAFAAAMGDAAVGDASFGDVTLTGGDFAFLRAVVGAAVNEGTVGNGTIGEVAAMAGESAEVWLELALGGLLADSIGDFAVDGIDIATAQDGLVSVQVRHGAMAGNVGTLGDFTIGDVSMAMGDNAQATLAITQFGEHAGDAGDAEGDFVVGDVSIAASATATADGSGGSRIDVDIVRTSAGLVEEGAEGGDFVVGDIDLSGGDEAAIDLDVRWTGEYAAMGDASIGNVAVSAGDDATDVRITVDIVNDAAGSIGTVTVAGLDVALASGSAARADIGVSSTASGGDVGAFTLGGMQLDLGEGSEVDVNAGVFVTDAAEVGGFTIGDVVANLGKGASADLSDIGVQAGAIGDVAVGGLTADLGEGADIVQHAAFAADAIGAATLGGWDIHAAAGADVQSAITFSADTLDGVFLSGVKADAVDGAQVVLALAADAASAGDWAIGDIDLTAGDEDEAAGQDKASGARVELAVTQSGGDRDDLDVGDITLVVEGTQADDELWVSLASNGDIVIGNLTVGGEGFFSFDSADHADANTSVLSLDAGGTVTIGNVDFSAFVGDAHLDLHGMRGAAFITGGAGDDVIRGNGTANVIAGGDGADAINLADGGNDTVVTKSGDSGRTAGTLDVVSGFTAGTVVSGALSGGDKLDFNLAAGTAGNYVENAANFSTLAEFTANAAGALNSTVRYFVQDNGTDTYVAVNFGSGEADLVIVLAGVGDATSLQFQNFIA